MYTISESPTKRKIFNFNSKQLQFACIWKMTFK